jgi:hypothetical protein
MFKFLFYSLLVAPFFSYGGNPTETDSLKSWSHSATTALNFSQVSFSNWSSGGESSISATGLLKCAVAYKDATKIWDNSLDIAFGIIRQGDLGKVAKSDDRIELNSSYGWSAFKKWYYNMSVNLKSQSAKGFKSPLDSTLISDFLAPAYSSISIGLSHKSTNDNLHLQVLPLSGKITYVNNQELADAGAFGVESAQYNDVGVLIKPGERMRSEFGGTLKVHYKNTIGQNVSIDTKATLFSNYKDQAGSIDVDWQLLLLMKINKYLSANITTHLIYDEDVSIALDLDKDGVFESSGPRVQFKELFGLGLSYSF